MSTAPDCLYLKSGYQSRLTTTYFDNGAISFDGIVHQPDVYPVAAYLATHFQADWIIDIGCGRADKLSHYANDFFVAGIDTGADLAHCQATYPFGTWLDVDLEEPAHLPLSDDQLAGSIVVCSDVIEHLVDPRPLLDELARIRTLAAAIVISTPDRDRARGVNDAGPPANPFHTREWSAEELGRLLTASNLAPAFLGFTMNNDDDWQKSTILAIIEGGDVPPLEKAPDEFRVLAVVTGHNERDILPFTLRRLLAGGLEVVYVDNWSTDGTFDTVASEFSNSIRMVRFPETDTKSFDLADLLSHVEQVGRESSADWVIHHDADEIREGPWPGVGLRDSIWNVDRRGFTAINHQVLDFRPVSDETIAVAGSDPAEALVWWQHLTHPANLVQVKGWRNQGQPVHLAQTGGHEARFPGRRIFPYRFLLRHYPLRSAEHARRKIFMERANRWNEQERKLGWHRHYDDASPDDPFVWPKATLHEWDSRTFSREFLAERLTGVGVLRDERKDEWVEGVTNPATATRVELRRLRTSCDEMTAENRRLESQLHEERRRVAAEREERAAAQRLAADAEHTLGRVTGSRSWTLTQPLRIVAGRLRRAGRRLRRRGLSE